MAQLLNKLLAEPTKSRPRHSNDNGLVESKNAAVIRKHIGYGYIAASNAQAIGAFYREHLNPYLNFHRPCGVPEVIPDKKGKQRRVYRRYATPWELLQQVPQYAGYLKPGGERRGTGAASEPAQRYPRGPPDARSQAEAIRRPERKTQLMKTAEEMTAYGRPGKPTAGFPRRPQALEIAARFPHSLSRGGPWKSGKPTPGFPLFHRSTIYMDRKLKQKTRRPEARSCAPHFRLILRLENAG